MAAAGQMAEFFATLGFKVNQADIKKVDKTLDYIEKRVRKMVEGDLDNLKVNITGFRFSEGFNTRLYKALQKKMTIVNNKKGLSPEITISKFDVDKMAFLREMRAATNYVENNLRVRIRPDAGRPIGGAGGARSGGGGVSRFGAGMGAGAAAGNLGRGFIPGLGLAFGVSQMNQLNQQLIGQNLAATAVFGNQEAGREQLDWVRDLGNKIGFDYRSQANPYMKMAAAGKTAGMSTGNVQEIFTGMAEYGRVMGLNDEDMKGSMRAVEQMLNKGQVYAEELKMQLGEKFPAAIQLMAEAVSGGDTEKLFDMMEKGEVSSIEALPKFAKILSRQARVGGALTEAMKTSLAEQMRFNNTFNDLVMFLSEAGFEEGQAGIFRTMADFFKEMKPLLSSFGEMWLYVADILRVPLGLFVDLGRGIEALSEYTGVAKGQLLGLGTVVAGLLFPLTRTITIVGLALTVLEDFTAFLSGRNSLIGTLLDQFKADNPEQYTKTIEAISESFKSLYEVVKMIGEGWKLIWDTLSDVSAIEATLNTLRTIANEIKAAADALLLLTGKKNPNEYNTHFGQDEGAISYGVKGVSRIFKDPIQTMTDQQRSNAVTEDEIFTLIKRLRDINFADTGDMSSQQLKDFNSFKDNVKTTESYLENKYNIEINSNSNPDEIAQEVMRQIEDRDNQSAKQLRSKSAGES